MDITLTIASFGAATAIGVVSFILFNLVNAVPGEDRTFKDRPPGLLRMVWIPTQMLAWYFGPRMSVITREAVLKKLRKAELDFAVSPQQWFAARFALSGTLGAVTAVLGSLAEFSALTMFLTGSAAGYVWPDMWLRDQIKRKELRILRDLPTYLDVLTLAVEGGCSITSGIGIAVEKAPESPLRRAFQRLLREVRAGKSRADALKSMEERLDMPATTSLTTAMFQAEKTGAALGTVLRAQATQRTNERFARAEKLAMEAPVKMLGPLVMCIFPCTFIVLGFPIVMKFIHGGF
jgi:tight adherence protein C